MAKKIAIWARIGQLAYWLLAFFDALSNMADPSYVADTVTTIEWLCSLVMLVCGILITEAIVNIISGFAKLMDNKK